MLQNFTSDFRGSCSANYVRASGTTICMCNTRSSNIIHLPGTTRYLTMIGPKLLKLKSGLIGPEPGQTDSSQRPAATNQLITQTTKLNGTISLIGRAMGHVAAVKRFLCFRFERQEL